MHGGFERLDARANLFLRFAERRFELDLATRESLPLVGVVLAREEALDDEIAKTAELGLDLAELRREGLGALVDACELVVPEDVDGFEKKLADLRREGHGSEARHDAGVEGVLPDGLGAADRQAVLAATAAVVLEDEATLLLDALAVHAPVAVATAEKPTAEEGVLLFGGSRRVPSGDHGLEPLEFGGRHHRVVLPLERLAVPDDEAGVEWIPQDHEGVVQEDWTGRPLLVAAGREPGGDGRSPDFRDACVAVLKEPAGHLPHEVESLRVRQHATGAAEVDEAGNEVHEVDQAKRRLLGLVVGKVHAEVGAPCILERAKETRWKARDH